MVQLKLTKTSLITPCTWLDVIGQVISQDGVEDGVRVDEEGLSWVHHGIITRQILKSKGVSIKTKTKKINT